MVLCFFSLLIGSLLASCRRIHHTADSISASSNEFLTKRSQFSGLVPTSVITRIYEKDGKISAIVNLTMKHPAVVLDDIKDISSVHCTDSSFDIAFVTGDALDVGFHSWTQQSSITFVTNHISGCHEDYEGGFYVSRNIYCDEGSQMLTAEVEKLDLADVASSIQATFWSSQTNSSIYPQPWDTTSTSPAGQDVSDPPLVVGRTEEGYFRTTFDYSGYLDYVIGDQRPKELYIDVNITSADAVPLTLNITNSYNNTVAFQEPPLSSYIYGIGVPAILELQPSLQYAGGAQITAASATVARTNMTSELLDGKIHLDLVNPENTYTSGLWDGNYDSAVGIDPVANIQLTPFIVVTGLVVVNITGIENTFIQAFKSTARSVYDFQVTGQNDFCTRTSYGYKIDAFNLEGWRKTLYYRQDPFTEDCQ